ncbi:hypothetical protein ACFCXP_37590 [Streptomyces niveus]|uniref:hypothetical protein n=1 Tax=Streptomyces niveus TaxID=193462 RepID=UPI0035DB58BC
MAIDTMNENLELTAGRTYAWTAVITEGPLRPGANPAKDCAGKYGALPGDTVGDALAGIRDWFADRQGIRASSVTVVSYTLQEVK